MKFPLSWLLKHLDTKANLATIADALTKLGLEVENIDNQEHMRPLKIARIITADPHPNADKLQLLQVDIGEAENLKIVCGAPNAKAGLISALAPIGTYLPKLDIKIKAAKVRGELSHGMMCSASELGLPGNSEGIIELDETAPIGDSFAEYAGLIDPVIEIYVTPNRADCNCIYGIARDLAAFGLGTLKPLPPVTNILYSEETKPRFKAALDKDRDRDTDTDSLAAYCEIWGIAGRSAIAGISAVEEKQQTIGDHWVKAYLAKSDIAIADNLSDHERGVLACLAYIKHDLGVEIGYKIMYSDHTIALYSAQLENNSANTIYAAPDFLEYALRRAQQLIAECYAECYAECDAVTSSAMQPTQHNAIYDNAIHNRVIEFAPSLVKRLTSLTIDKDEMKRILEALGCVIEGFSAEAESTKSWAVMPPIWRRDLNSSVNLVEEIIRIYGLDKLEPQPLALPESCPAMPAAPPAQRPNNTDNTNGENSVFAKYVSLASLLKHVFAACGFCEIVSWSFISHAVAIAFGGGAEGLQLTNPINENMSDMRPSLLPGLIRTAAANAANGNPDVSLFEVSNIYLDDTTAGQKLKAAGLRGRNAKFNQSARHWRNTGGTIDVFDVKQDAITLLDMAGINIAKLTFEPGAPSYYHPGRSGLIKIGSAILGDFGELHPDICEIMDVRHNICVFELDLQAVAAALSKQKKSAPYKDINMHRVYRDLSFTVSHSSPAADLQKAAATADQLIEKVNIFDIFTGEPLASDMKSVALEIVLRPSKSILSTEIDDVMKKIIANIYEKTGAILRS